MNSRITRLADKAFFHNTGYSDGVFFAEVPAPGGRFYGVALQPDKNRIYCNCPFFPKPCLHGLAFAAFFEKAEPTTFPDTGKLPPWVNNMHFGLVSKPSEHPEAAFQAKIQRRFERLERATGGFDELETWLSDTVRRGLATVISEDPQWHLTISARLADASLPGVSRLFRLMQARTAAGTGWESEVLGAMADAYLALRAFRKRHVLPEELLHDLQTYIGIAAKKSEVAQIGEEVADVWAVFGQIEEAVEDSLRLRRTWLYGGKSQRFGLLLEYEYGRGGFLPGLVPGYVVQGRAIYYPSAFPLRILFPEELITVPRKVEKLPGYADFKLLFKDFASAIGCQPWLLEFPATFPALTPIRQNGVFYLADEAGITIPLAADEKTGWKILALSLGRPVGFFGEWDGKKFKVLSILADGRLVKI